MRRKSVVIPEGVEQSNLFKRESIVLVENRYALLQLEQSMQSGSGIRIDPPTIQIPRR